MKLNRLLAGTLALVLVAGLGTPAFAQQTDALTGETISETELILDPQSGFRPFVDCNVDSGDIVAFDVSLLQDPASHSIMITDLEANGFLVREVNIQTQGIPQCIVKLVLTSLDTPTTCFKVNYAPADITLIQNWINAGGATYIMGENQGCSTGDEYVPLINALGTPTIVPPVFQILVSGIDYDPNNPVTLWNGVNSWQVLLATQFSLPTDGVVATYTTGNGAVIAKPIGQGCVVIIGNTDQHRDLNINDFDNRPLALNTLVFLNECVAPIVGGELLPIDSTALMLAGIQSSAIWMLPVLAGVAGSAFGILYIKSRRN